MTEVHNFIDTIIGVFRILIFVYVLMSWVPNLREGPIGEMLGKIVEPYISIFRRFIPPIGGMIDISPIVAIIALWPLASGIKVVLSILFGDGS